jgi:hypothetical protein
LRYNQPLEVIAGTDAAISVAALQLELPLSEIYAGIKPS